MAENSAQSLLTLIDDILDFSKIEAGKLDLDITEFNLHMLMGDFAHAIAGRVGDKPVELVCAVAPNVCNLLQGDPGRLRQVLMNLVGNAVKFTRQGEVVVRVDLISESDTAVWLRFSVRDTGIGIPQDKQQKLFSSFTQVDASTTRQYGGTGLGLAISKKLVELMAGEIGMESKEGEGSEFWFTLHFGKQPACRQANSFRVPVEGTRILVVDDNATNREVLTAQMQAWGAVAVAVESGSTALSCLRYAATSGNPFHVAVLDMMMPGMDGATLGSVILSDDTLKSTPLVMMTSLGQRGDALRFREIGFAAYLVKPVRPSDLFDCLAVVLTGKQQEQKHTLITRHTLEAARRSNARILLVEDNLTNQEVARGMLRRMGAHADVAADGKQAIKALEAQPYDLVLMDVQMPEMDGYEATRVIRDIGSRVLNHNIPIIATTAHVMAGDIERCLKAGMSDYVAKPIDPLVLSKIVEKWLKRRVHSVAVETAVELVTERKALPRKLEDAALVFNREAFLERMMGDEDFALEVVAGFVKELPLLVIALKEQVELGALEPIRKEAHKMKGSAANIGGDALRDVALKIEQACKSGDLETAVRSIPDLEMQAARLSRALKEWAI